MGQGRAPGVQHGGKADTRAQVLGVGGDRVQRLGGGLDRESGLVRGREAADREVGVLSVSNVAGKGRLRRRLSYSSYKIERDGTEG